MTNRPSNTPNSSTTQSRVAFIREMLDDPSSKHGRYFMLCIQALILVSIISFTLETLPNKSDAYYLTLEIIEICIVAIFTIEYLLRVIYSANRIRFVFSFFGLVDLISIAPFYFALLFGLNATWLRVVRTLRLLRLFKLFRYNRSIARFANAFRMAKDELVLFGASAMIAIYISGAGIYVCENEAQPDKFSSVLDGVWWAIVTLTTVGYGDAFPVTPEGKIFTFIILIIGLAIVSIPTALIASSLTRVRSDEDTQHSD